MVGTAMEGHPAATPVLGSGRKWALAAACVLVGFAALAARSIPSEAGQVAYGAVLAALLLGAALYLRSRPELASLAPLGFGFFVFALVQVLNNSLPKLFLAAVLRETPTAGDPLAATVWGTVWVQLFDTAIALVPILVLAAWSGAGWRSIYLQRGRFGWPLLLAIAAFAIFFALTASLRLHRLFPMHAGMTTATVLSLTPALLLMVASNGLQEEFLFRALFLRRYAALFGFPLANLVQALVFAFAHLGVTYTPSAIFFVGAIVFPLGLLLGWLMHRSDGVWAPVIFHAGADLPIYLAFLSYVA